MKRVIGDRAFAEIEASRRFSFSLFRGCVRRPSPELQHDLLHNSQPATLPKTKDYQTTKPSFKTEKQREISPCANGCCFFVQPDAVL